MCVVSVPASGSVTPNATCSLPAATSGRYCCFISSVPWTTTGCMPNTDRCNAEAPFMHAPDAATSPSTVAASRMPCPPPP